MSMSFVLTCMCVCVCVCVCVCACVHVCVCVIEGNAEWETGGLLNLKKTVFVNVALWISSHEYFLPAETR